MKKDFKTYVEEFTSCKKDTQRLTEVFQDIYDLKESVTANPKFKKRLEKRLHALMHIQSMKYQVQERRFYLFAGTFASFLFFGIFLYYMSTNVFVKPFFWKSQTIQTPYILDDSSSQGDISDTPLEEIETSTSSTPAPFYDESQWDNSDILPIRSHTDVIDAESDEGSNKDEQGDVFSSDEATNFTEEPEDNFSQDTQENIFPATIQENEQANEEDFSQQRVSNEVLPKALRSDGAASFSADNDFAEETSSFQDSPIQTSQTFKEYCIDVSWIYVNYWIAPECHKKWFVCEEDEYIQTWMCFSDLEIQEFIDEYSDE